jgi:hypothetical protein
MVTVQREDNTIVLMFFMNNKRKIRLHGSYCHRNQLYPDQDQLTTATIATFL